MAPMSEEPDVHAQPRWRRREKRQQSEKERLQKHGAGLRRVYIDAIKKRIADHKKR